MTFSRERGSATITSSAGTQGRSFSCRSATSPTKRSILGIVFTLIALVTSMFWFPKPETVGPQVKEFLEAEIEGLFGEWTLSKILMTLLGRLWPFRPRSRAHQSTFPRTPGGYLTSRCP